MLQDYFKLLGVQKQYNIIKSEVQAKYLLIQSKYHPDLAKSEDEYSTFNQYIMQINNAYKVLQNDCLRAEYMIKISGTKINNKIDKINLSNKALDPSLVFSLYEKINNTNNIIELNKIKLLQLNQKQKILDNLAICFDQNKVVKAYDFFINLKYIVNIIQHINLRIKYADKKS